MRSPVWLILLGLTAGACSREAPAPPDLEVRRFADEVTPGTPPQHEQVAGVLRPVLTGTHVQVLAPAPSVRVASDGGAEASVRCPARLAGQRAVLSVGSAAAAKAGLAPLARRVQCPDSAETPVAVTLPAYPGIADAVWVLRGLTADVTETKPIQLVAGARLRAHLGIAAGVEGRVSPGRFRVVAVDGEGHRTAVLDRELDPAANAADAGWIPIDVDLDPVRRALGPEVRLIFEAHATDEDTAMAFPFWGDPAVVWPRPPGTPRPVRNVVLVSIDTLRADRLGLYGARRATSPTLDALGAESTVFETVIAPAPWTLPSHTSMMTGLHECVHGMTGIIGRPFPAGLRPLARLLRDAGYSTAAVTEDGFVDATAFVRGFGFYRETRDGNDRVGRTVAQASAWLRDEATEPFFLFVHTYQTHDPYFSPPPFDTMFTTGDGVTPHGAQAPAGESDLAKYDAAIRYTDASIAPLLAAVRATPRGDRTLLIVTSDHGEAFGEHGYTGHGRTLHEEVLRVPLLVHGPGLVAAGRRVVGLAGVIDVTPTILDLVGLPVPPGLTGVSLAPQARAGTGEPPPLPARRLFAENTLDHTHRLAIRSPSWKAMFEGERLEIFDLEHDPAERAAVDNDDLATQATMARAEFDAECRRQKAALDAVAAVAEPLGLPDAGRQRQLKALGYVE